MVSVTLDNLVEASHPFFASGRRTILTAGCVTSTSTQTGVVCGTLPLLSEASGPLIGTIFVPAGIVDTVGAEAVVVL